MELASVGATHEIEASLLKRSVSCMEEGRAALENALYSSKQNEDDTTGVRILEKRSFRLEASVRDMEQDVMRARRRLDAAKRMNQARTSARGAVGHSRTASTQMNTLKEDMTSLRSQRQKSAIESEKILKSLAIALEEAKKQAVKESDLNMEQIENEAAVRRAQLEAEATQLENELELAENRCRRGGARKRLFDKEFEMLKLGLDERRNDHELKMNKLNNDIMDLDNHLEGRRARTRNEREDALLRMETQLREELENKWRETLETVKTTSSNQLAAEEGKYFEKTFFLSLLINFPSF